MPDGNGRECLGSFWQVYLMAGKEAREFDILLWAHPQRPNNLLIGSISFRCTAPAHSIMLGILSLTHGQLGSFNTQIIGLSFKKRPERQPALLPPCKDTTIYEPQCRPSPHIDFAFILNFQTPESCHYTIV
jgi:hypothetical protein